MISPIPMISMKIVAASRRPEDLYRSKENWREFLATNNQAKLARKSTVKSTGEKIGAKVNAKDLKLCPVDVQEFVNISNRKKSDGKKETEHEKKRVGKDSKITRNTDLVVVAKGHPPYFQKIQEVLEGKIEIKKLGSAASPAGTAAEESQIDTIDKIKNITIFEDAAKTQVMRPTRLIALLKAAHMGLIFRRDDYLVTACLSGHWARLATIEGDHAYPGSFVSARFFYLFSDQYKLDHEGQDPLAALPDVLKANVSGVLKPSKALLMMHYLDARNILGICKTCNGSKNDNYLSWLINNPYFGVGFVNTYFPLDYSAIVPRTRQGNGLADAMLYHFAMSHTANEALNLRNQLGDDEVSAAGTHHSIALVRASAVVVQEVGARVLNAKEAKQLGALLAKIQNQI